MPVHERHVGLAIKYSVALQDDSLSDGLRQVAFARPDWTEKQSVLSFVDEGAPDTLFARLRLIKKRIG
jgi:hypothetical protein